MQLLLVICTIDYVGFAVVTLLLQFQLVLTFKHGVFVVNTSHYYVENTERCGIEHIKS